MPPCLEMRIITPARKMVRVRHTADISSVSRVRLISSTSREPASSPATSTSSMTPFYRGLIPPDSGLQAALYYFSYLWAAGYVVLALLLLALELRHPDGVGEEQHPLQLPGDAPLLGNEDHHTRQEDGDHRQGRGRRHRGRLHQGLLRASAGDDGEERGHHRRREVPRACP